MKSELYTTCTHCYNRHNLNELRKLHIKIEPDVNYKQEDTIHFKCPTCNQYVDHGIIKKINED